MIAAAKFLLIFGAAYVIAIQLHLRLPNSLDPENPISWFFTIALTIFTLRMASRNVKWIWTLAALGGFWGAVQVRIETNALFEEVRNHHYSSGDVSALIRLGADANGRDRTMRTPLFSLAEVCQAAKSSTDKEVFESLLKAGADIDARDIDQATPLMVLAEKADGCRDLAELFISAGANVNARDKSGRTPLTLALHNYRDGKKTIATLLVDQGALKSVPNTLELAVDALQSCATPFVQSLLDHGVKMPADAAQISARKGCRATVEVLQKANKVESADADSLLRQHFDVPIVFIIDSGLEKLDQVTHGSLVMALVMRHYLNIRTVDLDEGVSKFSAKRLLKALQWILGYRKEYPRSTVIVNLSWGSIDPDPLVTAAIGSLVSSGVVVVAAAGNDGKPQCAYPAGLPGVIAVASVVKAPRGSFSIAPYSNRGSCISAAGVQDSAAFLRDIRRSAIIPADSLFKSSYLEQEEQLSKLAASVGTSFAAPIVTGALAAHIERTHEFDREHFFMGKTAHVEGLGAVPVFQ